VFDLGKYFNLVLGRHFIMNDLAILIIILILSGVHL